MKQYRITSENILLDSPDDCYLSPDDIAHELKITQAFGGLNAAARLHEFKMSNTEQKPAGVDKGKIQREQNIKPGTDEWFKLWFSKPNGEI